MFNDLDFNEEKLFQLIDFLTNDLNNYKNSENPKELVIKIKQRTLNTINNYVSSVNNALELCNNAVERLQEYKSKAKRLEIEHSRLQENYKKLQLYAQAHGIDVDLVENYSHIKDFYA